MNATRLRSMVERWLTDACTIADPGTAPEFDPASGYSATPGEPVYTGACRVRPAGASTPIVGDAPLALHAYLITIPWDTTGVAVNQIVTVTSSDDPDLIGRTFRVVDVEGGTNAPHRRLVAEQILDDAAEETGS